MSWKRVVKDDCVRSCLIELKSFLLSKFDVDPTHRVLMFLLYFLLVPCKTRCFQVNVFRISVFLVQRITDVKNTACLLLKFCPPDINPELMMESKLIVHPM